MSAISRDTVSSNPPAIKLANLADARQSGLSESEFQSACDILGRVPNLVELGIFSVMWSEHCSYKSSRRHLRKLPTTGPRVICGPGENAGIVDIGDNQACVFKMESHNHPSFIEPFQGAATGVGGILRDVFTMGARPVALLNALRFGAPDHPKTRNLVRGVVAGIGSYGNCVGVPTIGGETNFYAGYNGNILVNAMCVGIVEKDQIFYSAAPHSGLSVLYVGSKTGRDGIHGATMASAEFDDASAEKRPTVQVGDPFTEKLLIESCLELMRSGAVAAIQDMGAAGLTSSSVEMAGKGGVGIALDLDKIPQRETQMSAYEIMLSESQERMLLILKPGCEADAIRIIEKWGLDVALIGETTDTARIILHHRGAKVCDLPLAPLSDAAPDYDRPWTEPEARPIVRVDEVAPPDDNTQALLQLLRCPDIASKKWIWEQYDRHVGANTLEDSATPCDAAIIRVASDGKRLAITCDVTPRYVEAGPYQGGRQAVAEAYRNLCAAGADPIAVTDNLNFGNPERPEIMGQLVRAIEGMAQACRALEFPVVSGNVSLYNETNGVAIPPTPAIGGVGLIPAGAPRMGFGAPKAGACLAIIGATHGWLGASLFLREIHGREEGAPPPVDEAREKLHGQYVLSLIREGLVQAVHDVSDGGIAICLSEIAMASGLGMLIDLPHDIPAHAFLYGEDQGRYIVAIDEAVLDNFEGMAMDAGIDVMICGQIAGTELHVRTLDATLLSIPVTTLRECHEAWMPAWMARD